MGGTSYTSSTVDALTSRVVFPPEIPRIRICFYRMLSIEQWPIFTEGYLFNTFSLE